MYFESYLMVMDGLEVYIRCGGMGAKLSIVEKLINTTKLLVINFLRPLVVDILKLS